MLSGGGLSGGGLSGGGLSSGGLSSGGGPAEGCPAEGVQRRVLCPAEGGSSVGGVALGLSCETPAAPPDHVDLWLFSTVLRVDG